MITPEQALWVVERIAAEIGEGRTTPEQLQAAIDAIYRISHSCHPEHGCYDVHTEWREEAERLYADWHEREIYKELQPKEDA